MQQSIIEKITQEYIDQYLENGRKADYTEITAQQGAKTVLYKDLPDTVMEGYPFASDFVLPDGRGIRVEDYEKLSEEEKKQCQLRFYYLPYNHEIYIGTTGCGKTTGCIEPQLRAISTQKNKPCLFVTDPKGELFDHNAEYLESQGYKLFVLNFKEIIRSDKWNPLLEIYDKQMALLNAGKNYEVNSDIYQDNPDYQRMGKPEEFKKARAVFVYKNMVFPKQQTLLDYVQYEKDMLEAEIDQLINQFASMIIVPQSKNDKTWEYGAQELLKGLIQCMLEDASNPKSGFTRDQMNFRNLMEYYSYLRYQVLSKDTRLHRVDIMKNKSEKAYRLLSTALDNAGNTMRSYCGVFNDCMKDWFQGHIFALTSGNTVEITSAEDQPFAIFLITRDYEKSDFMVASIFVDWVYRSVLELVEKNKFKRAFHFLLDEFGNIPTITDFENKISTARSRNVWFHLVLQSYSQLTNKYDSEVSAIIMDNCSQIFLGSTNMQTKETFSKSCGKHMIPTLYSRLSPGENSVTEVPLIPVSALNLIKPGQIYTLRDRMPVILSQFIRSYIAAEQGSFADRINSKGLKNSTPMHIESFSSDTYVYPKLKIKEKEKANSNFMDDFDY